MTTKAPSEWEMLTAKLQERFGMAPEIDAIIFMIGVQELGKGFQKLKKDEKLNVMHVAICTLLEPYGYYTFEGKDPDGWPHWKLNENIPALTAAQQNNLMIRAIIDYFKSTEFIA